MNDDLQNRLRDALDAAARTVPDGPPPHDLGTVVDIGRSRRPSTLLIAVAAAAVVVAIAVPYAAQRDRTAPPLQVPCPGGVSATPSLPATPPAVLITGSPAPPTGADRLPIGPPPRVPYTVTDASGAGYLQDGATRVPLEAGRLTRLIDRLDCRWLVARKKAGPEITTTEFGILEPSGEFTRLGSSVNRVGGLGLSVGLSPDATKVAYTALTAGNTARLAVLDLATGAEITSRQVSAHTAVLGWNDSGVWLHSGGDGGGHRFARWLPGGDPQPVAAPELLYPYRSTGRMLVNKYQGATSCLRVVELGTDGQLDDLTESCVAGSSRGPTLSPDGKVFIHHDGVARLVPEGTALPSMPAGLGPGPYVWEDDDHVLIEVHGIGRRTIVRCQVRTGDCERVYASTNESALQLVSQDPYRLLGF